MDTILLDTDILLKLFKKEKNIIEKIESLKLDKKADFKISAITFYEYLRGSYKNKNLINKKLLDLMRVLAKLQISVINFDNNVAHSCVIVYSDLILKKSGKEFKNRELDLLIGGTAIALDCPLFTDNVKDFQDIPNIKLI
jgi:tRNA(fMet)-specific endonuclease VapC